MIANFSKILQGSAFSFHQASCWNSSRPNLLTLDANINKRRREVEENERDGDGGEEIFDLAETRESVLELDVLAAAPEISVYISQNIARGLGREAGQRKARNDAVRFLKPAFFQIYINIFRAVVYDYQAGIFYTPQFLRQSRFNFKAKKKRVRAHFFEDFSGDDARSASQLDNAPCVLKINLFKHFFGKRGRALND